MRDSRFNMYVLEHGYQSMIHRSVHFWDAPFFYPHKNVVAYSDNLLGNLPIYSTYRALKFSREQSFQYWTLLSLALNYISGYLALRSFGARRLAAGLAAYVFAFGLPVYAQIGHIQLLPRYLVPWIFVCASNLAVSGRIRDFAWIAALMVGQMYLGIYGGILTGVTLAPYLLAFLVFGDCRQALFHITGLGKTMAVRALIVLFAALALLPIAVPYLHATAEVGTRSWDEISTMLPRLGSWLFPTDSSILWSWITHLDYLALHDIPVRWEHRNFVGLTMLLSLLAWPFLKAREGRLAYLASRAWWSLFFCFLLTLFIWDWSFWKLLLAVPGVGAIRAVTRIVLFMLFPMSMVLAATLDQCIDRVRSQYFGAFDGEVKFAALGCLLAIFVFVDSGVRSVGKVSFSQSMQEVDKIKHALKNIKPRNGYAFWVCQRSPGAPDYLTQLDAMLASQDLGIPTLNGYSGWDPPEYSLVTVASDAEPETYKLKRWLSSNDMDENARVIVLGNDGKVLGNPSLNYAIGQPILFSDVHSEAYLRKGFLGVGTGGIWTRGEWASISMSVLELPKRDLTLTLSGDTLRPPKGKQNTLRLKVNGSEIATRPVLGAESFVWNVNVPREVAGCKDGILEIGIGSEVFRVRDCQPKNKDSRALGVLLKTLTFE